MKERNLKLFYLHELLFQFSDSMLIIVLPIFIYQLFDSIAAAFFFILAWNIIHAALFLPIFDRAMKWKRPKLFMMAGIIFYISSLACFSQATPESKVWIIPATLLFALYVSFYWMVRHWFISVNSDYKVIGRQMSIIFLIRTGISFVAPIVGGAISQLVSFNVTFLLGVIGGFLSLIPILLFNAPPTQERYNAKALRVILNKPEIKAISGAYFWEGISLVTIHNAWVLIFAIYIGNILDLGLLVGFTALLTGITIWFTGIWFDKKGRAKLLTKVCRARSLAVMAYLSIIFFHSLSYVAVIEFLNKLLSTMQGTIMESYFYAYGNKVHPINFMLSREAYLNISRIVSAGILGVSFMFLSAQWLWAVLLTGAISVLGIVQLKKSDHLLSS